MKWKKYRLETTTEGEDLVSAVLAELGVEGVEIEDKIPLTQEELEAMYVDIGPAVVEDDGIAYISFYLDEEADGGNLLEALMKELEGFRGSLQLGTLKLEESVTQDVDWVNNWKQYFHSFEIDDILVTPSWEKNTEKGNYRHVIEIDPGTAFGTGKHETTNLCIRALKDYVKAGVNVLDIGIGSGILGLMALKFGAAHVIGTDLDIQALGATQENMDKNGLGPDKYEVHIGDLCEETELFAYLKEQDFGLITANILAEVLVGMMPYVKELLSPGGIYITSGILNEKEDFVKTAMEEAGLVVLEVRRQGEWSAIVAGK